MSERNIHATWKVREKRVSKKETLMVGCVYQSQNNIGVLVSIGNDVAVLQTKNKKLIKVQVQTLKIKTDE